MSADGGVVKANIYSKTIPQSASLPAPFTQGSHSIRVSHTCPQEMVYDLLVGAFSERPRLAVNPRPTAAAMHCKPSPWGRGTAIAVDEVSFQKILCVTVPHQSSLRSDSNPWGKPNIGCRNPAARSFAAPPHVSFSNVVRTDEVP